MKKTLKTILLITTLASLSLFNGCEDLADIPLNIPFSVPINATGSEVPFYGEYKFCLNEYEEWEDNRDEIKSARYISAAFWTTDDDFTPSDLEGTITASLTDKFGKILFEDTLPNTSPAEFRAPNPYKFELTSEEVDEFNAYLDEILKQEDENCAMGQETFTAVLTVTDVTGDPDYQILGKVEIVIEAMISTD